MLGVVFLSIISVVYSASTVSTPDLHSAFTVAFKQLDVNSDGHIDVSEFIKTFDNYDANHDGKLSIHEYMASTSMDKAFAKAVFEYIDTGRHNAIPRGDAGKIFKQYDANDDGVITSPEFLQEYQRIFNAVVKTLGYIPTTPPPK